MARATSCARHWPIGPACTGPPEISPGQGPGRAATAKPADPGAVGRQAAELAGRTGRVVFVTMAERGIVGALPARSPQHVPAMPVRGPIDVVGAGDAVTAN